MSYQFSFKSYATNVGFIFSIVHLFIFSNISTVSFAVALISFLFSLFFVTIFSNKDFFARYAPKLAFKEEYPLITVSIALILQALISLYHHDFFQALVGFGFAFGNILSAIQLDCESQGKKFMAEKPFLKIALRPEIYISLAFAAIAFLSSSYGVYFVWILFLSLVVSLLPDWKNQPINPSWSRLLILVYMLFLFLLALKEGSTHMMLANFFICYANAIMVFKMNRNFKALYNSEAGLNITKSIW
jgi:hypothetical protein